MAKQFNWMRYAVILLTAIIVLLIVRNREKQFESREYPVFNVEKEAISAFNIAKGDQSVEIVLRDTLWTFQEPDTGDVDQDKVDRFLETVTTMTRGNYIASKPENYPAFQLDEESAIRLILYENDEIAGELFAGAASNSTVKDNIRYPGEPYIYQVDVKLTRQMRPQADFWRE